MKKLVSLFCLLFFIVGINQTGFAQKKVNKIYRLYKVDAYYLTIKKINLLKPEYQSLKEIQCILADCYWNIGEKDKSIKTYQNVAQYLDIPEAFKEKYERAVQKERKVDNQKENSILVESKPVPAAILKVSNNEEQALELPLNDPNKLLATVKNKKCSKNCIQVPLNKYDSPSTKNQDAFSASISNPVSTGDYRIRIGATTNLDDFNLSNIEALGAVEIQEWNNKKIVFIGHYKSVELAQNIINQHLSTTYKNAVVVEKKGGRYRSVLASVN